MDVRRGADEKGGGEMTLGWGANLEETGLKKGAKELKNHSVLKLQTVSVYGGPVTTHKRLILSKEVQD